MMNAKLNDKIFDAMLEVACGEVMDERIAEWDALNTAEHEFSPEFEQRMKKMFRSHTRKLRKKTRRKVLGRVAAVIIVVMALGFTFTMSVQALRVQFFNTIKEFAEEYIGFSFSDNANQVSDAITRPDYLPEGYMEAKVDELLSGVQIMYTNVNGDRIKYQQLIKNEGLDIKIDNEHTEPPYSIDINDTVVQVYERSTDGYDSFFIWETEDSFYMVSGTANPAELTKMVKSILK